MKKLLLIPLFLVLIVGLAILTMSGEWSVSRTHVIDAPPAQVHAVVERLSSWPEWSYWSMEQDPSAKFEFSGPKAGVGSIWSWESEGELGTGKITIVSSSVADGMAYDLSMEGMVLHGHISYKQVDGGTEVLFGSEGTSEGWMKIFSPFVDTLVGPSYESSLAGLEKYLKALPAADAAKALEAASNAGE